jgi:anti-sigma B factor antagonist
MTSGRTVTVLGEGETLQLAGELDAAGAQELHTALSDRVGRGEGDVVVDVARLAFIDSIGLGALVKAAGQLERQHRRLRVVGAQGAVRAAIEGTGLAARVGLED